MTYYVAGTIIIFIPSSHPYINFARFLLLKFLVLSSKNLMHVHVALSSHNLNIHRLHGLTGRGRREEKGKVEKEEEERTVANKSHFQSPYTTHAS